MNPNTVVIGGWRENHSVFEQRCRFAVINTLNKMLLKNLILNARCDFDCFYGLKRPDIVAQIEYNSHAISTMIIECKSCLKDLKSGYGLNLVGNINYIICPPSLTKEKINNHLVELGEEGIGILMLDKDDRIKLIQRSWMKDNSPRWLQMLGTGAGFGDY